MANWRADGWEHLQEFEQDYLKGRLRAAEAEFSHAFTELSAGGELSLAAQAWLAKCAVETGALDFGTCPQYQRFEGKAPDPAMKAYFSLLQGQWEKTDVSLLPERYRSLIQAGARVNREIAAISDPLSRLVAAGSAVRAGRFDEETLRLAADTASANGWRRPLAAYLTLLREIALKKGDAALAASLGDRIELILGK